jgi:hypothetical protein
MPPKITISLKPESSPEKKRVNYRELASSAVKKRVNYRVCPACHRELDKGMVRQEPDKGMVRQEPDKSVGRRSMSEDKLKKKEEPNRLERVILD